MELLEGPQTVLKLMPEEATAELTQIINAMEAWMVPPLTLLCAIVALLPKEGGERPITLLSKVYKIWAELQMPSVREHEQSLSAFWDTTIQKSRGVVIL